MFPEPTIQSLTAELDVLKTQQEQTAALAVYLGMTKEQAREYDARAERINQFYEKMIALTTKDVLKVSEPLEKELRSKAKADK